MANVDDHIQPSPLIMSQEKVPFANHSNLRPEATWYQHRCFHGAIDGRYGEVLETWD
jgi:hypothetical protein